MLTEFWIMHCCQVATSYIAISYVVKYIIILWCHLHNGNMEYLLNNRLATRVGLGDMEILYHDIEKNIVYITVFLAFFSY